MEINNFRELYLANLSELRDAEEQIANLLGEASQKAKHDNLKQALQHCREQAQARNGRLRKMLEQHSVNPDMHKDQAMQAMIQETRKMIGMLKGDNLVDAAMVGSIQRLGHYEIAACGTLATYADIMGLEDDKRALHGMVEEEEQTDQKLTALAKTVVNWDAAGRA